MKISRQNIAVDEKYKADGTEFYMCNLTAKQEIDIPGIKNCTFNRCNLRNITIDSSNILNQTNLFKPETEDRLLSTDERLIKFIDKYGEEF